MEIAHSQNFPKFVRITTLKTYMDTYSHTCMRMANISMNACGRPPQLPFDFPPILSKMNKRMHKLSIYTYTYTYACVRKRNNCWHHANSRIKMHLLLWRRKAP